MRSRRAASRRGTRRRPENPAAPPVTPVPPRGYQAVTGSGRVVSGASTVSTQVVKLNRPRPRSLWTKLVEAVSAVKMERMELLQPDDYSRGLLGAMEARA